MKKLLSIFILLAVIAAGTVACDAGQQKKLNRRTAVKPKTTATVAPTATASGLSVGTFCQSVLSANPNYSQFGITKTLAGKLQQIKPFEEIEKSLKGAGFECVSKETKEEYDEASDENYTYVVAEFSKTDSNGKTVIDIDNSEVKITFPDATEKNAFIATVKAKGFRYNSESEGYVMPGNEKAYWMGNVIKEKGNTVEIISFGD